MSPNVSTKTTLTGVAGAGVTIVIAIFGAFGIDITGELAAAIITVVTFAIAYFVPAKSGKYVDTSVPDDADLIVNRDDVDPNQFPEEDDQTGIEVEEPVDEEIPLEDDLEPAENEGSSIERGV